MNIIKESIALRLYTDVTGSNPCPGKLSDCSVLLFSSVLHVSARVALVLGHNGFLQTFPILNSSTTMPSMIYSLI